MKDKILDSQEYLVKMDRYFRAVNYISATQLYLLDNPLLKRPLEKSDVKKKIVGHWGTVPGQNFVYTHLNRVVKKYNLNMLLVSGPGHGGNFFVSNSYLEGVYTETYPHLTQDEEGLKRLNKQFSFPKGVGSHVTPETPGSINEGGELGYSLAHSFGAVFDNPNLIVTCVVGDGEAETGPLATSWQSNKFLNPLTDGFVIPVLHLNGFKINNPTVLSRIPNEELKAYFRGMGWNAYFVEGAEPMKMHKLMAETMDRVIEDLISIRQNAVKKNDPSRPIYPMIVLRTPKGWTGPKFIDGVKVEGNFMAHQVPYDMSKPNHLPELEGWLRSYRPEELFNSDGTLKEDIKQTIPAKGYRISENPSANGGNLLKELKVSPYDKFAVDVKKHGSVLAQDAGVLGYFVADIIKNNPKNFRFFCPDEFKSNRLHAAYKVADKNFNLPLNKDDVNLAPNGRIMDSYLSEHMCEGWLEGYLLTGRHGTFASYESFLNVVNSMIAQHVKWIKMSNELEWRKEIASLNLFICSNVWQQDHNGYTHQDPGVIDHLANKHPSVVRIYLPADANCLLSCYDHCIRSKNYVNAVVASKHPTYQWLSLEEAKEHCAKGAAEWKWASTYSKGEPDVVIACAGSTPTIEALACTSILKERIPNLKIKFVNVVDIMKLISHEKHPHGMTNAEFDRLFTKDKPVIFAYHGYASLIHELVWDRNNDNFDVYGYEEEGSITTAFDMRVLNRIDRFNLTKAVIKALPNANEYKHIVKEMDAMLKKHNAYIAEYGEDIPEVKNWKWDE